MHSTGERRAGEQGLRDPRRRGSTTESQPRTGYPSDLTEAQWREIDLLLPRVHDLGRRRTTDLREVVNAINYRWHTGCTWRMLPHDFPAWGTVYAYQRRWQRDGTLAEIREVLLRRSAA